MQILHFMQSLALSWSSLSSVPFTRFSSPSSYRVSSSMTRRTVRGGQDVGMDVISTLTSVMSQPAREFVVKFNELSLWSSDLLFGHFLLFMLIPPILLPYADCLHAMLLCEYFRCSVLLVVLMGCLQPGCGHPSRFALLYTH